jgi:ABC-type multidrug transport system fused ATPase/permease subunit
LQEDGLTQWQAMRISNVIFAAILLFGMSLLMQATSLFTQVVPGTAELPWLNQAEHLTLSGGMVVVIVMLWRAFQVKDAALVKMTEVVVQALAASASSANELRGIIKESVDAKRELRESIDLLRVGVAQLPCTNPKQR